MRIFPGPVDGRELYAAPWVPAADLADERGIVRDEFVWGALDCPSGIVTDLLDDGVGLILLGRLTAQLRRPVDGGEPHIAVAWPLGRVGRKLETASAVFRADGTTCAVGRVARLAKWSGLSMTTSWAPTPSIRS